MAAVISSWTDLARHNQRKHGPQIQTSRPTGSRISRYFRTGQVDHLGQALSPFE